MNKMKLENPKLTILIGKDSTEIEVHDSKSNTTFLRIALNPEQLSALLSRQGLVEVDADVYNLDKIGKTHENKDFVFEIPEHLNSKDEDILHDMAIGYLMSQDMREWIPDKYYRSQKSFFRESDKQYARVVIRRWV